MSDQSTGERVLEPGTKVEVRDAYEGFWHRGFVVEEVTDDGYRVRRTSDDSVLPLLARDVVRRERRNPMWWI